MHQDEHPQEKRRIEPQPMRFFSRRDFLELTSGAAVAAGLASGPLGASPERKLTPEELAEWRRSLFRPAPKLVYTSAANPQAAVPLGGIGCGNVYIGVGGHLKDWLIFNNVSPTQVPDSFFMVRARTEGGRSVTKVLQTPVEGYHSIGMFGGSYTAETRRSSRPARHVERVRLVGEYPFAYLDYEDDDLPVKVSLEAFSPFVPMDARRSAYPGVVFLFRLRNPSSRAVEVSLAATLHNAAGGGRAGGNQNRVLRRGDLAGVTATVAAGKRATLERPLELVFNHRGYNPRGLEKPTRLEVRRTQAASPLPEELRPAGSSGGARVLWLEDLDDLSVAAARELRSQVEAGAVLLLTGKAPELLNAWAAERSRPADAPRRDDLPFENFESGGYANWTVTGEAFGTAPARGTLPGQQAVRGFRGTFLVNSFLNGDAPTGRMLSKPFRIERRYIKFLVGGGSHAGRTCMNLLVDGKVVRTQTGRDNERLLPAAWDVSDLEGKEARLEIVDAESGAWGHINIDDIVFSDTPSRTVPPEVMEVLNALIPVPFAHWQWPGKPEPVEVDVSRELPEFRGGKVRVAGLASAKPSAPSQSADGALRFSVGSVGKGKVAVLYAPLMDPGALDPVLAGRQVLALAAALAGVGHRPAEGADPEDRAFGEMVIATRGPGASVLPAWTNPEALWTRFSREGRFEPIESAQDSAPTAPGDAVKTAVCRTVTVPPNGQATVPVFLAWRFPNYYFGDQVIGNRYTTFWATAEEALVEMAGGVSTEGRGSRSARRGSEDLRELTERFRSTFYDSTLPYWLLDCISSQVSTIRSEVCVWSADGTFAGYEGSDGCCPMNCSHVWGYEQTLARLFPDLERNMRKADLLHQQREDGGINNRIALPLQPHPTGERPFADGHASGVLKSYREHLVSADDSWLRSHWEHIRDAVGYLVRSLDENEDGIIEGEQWNTYDCAVYGPNSFIGTYYLAALRAGEEMAKLMGQDDLAERWHRIFESGQKRLVDLCWNGEYFVQVFPEYMERATQYGPGCLADQVIGQWWAHQLGLGYVIPKEMARTALQSIFRYNWLPDVSEHRHNQRVFADGHDKGLLCCSWPKGGRPPRPILYCDEVWTGVEYQVAAHMIYEGLTEEAFAIVRGARERYDGKKRNPWNEIECGGHYARAMANWSLLLALSGFHYNGPKGVLAFAPAITPEEFRCFYTSAGSWGSLSQSRSARSQTCDLDVRWGALELRTLRLQAPPWAEGADPQVRVAVGDRRIAHTARRDGSSLEIAFTEAPPLRLREGQRLRVTVSR